MLQQLQQVFAVPLGAYLVATLIIAAGVIMLLFAWVRQLRKDLAHQFRRIAFMRGEITAEQLIGHSPWPRRTPADDETPF
jgi:hypothetical protein